MTAISNKSQHTDNSGKISGLLRLPQVLALFPVSKTAWYAGVKSKKYPAPAKLGANTVAWYADDIAALIEKSRSGVAE